MEKVRFNSRRCQRLAGVLHQPQIEPASAIILTHGFRGSKEGGGKAVELAEKLAERGYLVFRFDFAGVGESEGEFDQITLSRQVADLQGAIDWLSMQYSRGVFVVGRSFGGSTALAAAAMDLRIKGLCLWSTPLDLTATFRGTLGDLYDRLDAGQRVSISDDKGLAFGLQPEFVADLKQHDLYRNLSIIAGRPILFLHGAKDQTVSLVQVERGYELAAPPKEIIVFPEGDHQFTQTWTAAWEALFNWLDKNSE